jgi:hypothetical protein
VRLQSTVATNNVKRFDLYGIPQSIDPKTTSTSTVSVEEKDWTKLGTASVTTDGTSSSVDTTFDLPKRTTYKGMVIDGWEIPARQFGADGTDFGLGGFVDSGFQFAAVPPETVKGNQFDYRGGGFGTKKLFALFTTGKTTKSFKSSDNGGGACGDSHGLLSTSELDKGRGSSSSTRRRPRSPAA